MTEPPRPDPEFHDEDLAALYRQAAREEPSARHDAAILAAAAADLARPAPRRQGWWPRWRLGLSLAATVLLSAGLVLLVGREQARDATLPAPVGEAEAPAQQPMQKSAPQSARESAQKRAQDVGREALSQEPSREKHQAAPATPPASAPARPAEPWHDAPAPAAAPRQEADQAAPPAAPAAKAKVGAPAASAPASPAPFPAPPPAPSLESRQDAEGSMTRKLAKEAPEPPPEAQLAEIRALRQAGREDEARSAMAAFLRRHPDYPLPADLKDLGPPPR